MKLKTFLRFVKDSSAGPHAGETRTHETDAPAAKESNGHPESLASARFAKRIADMRRMPGLKPLRSPRTSR